MWTQVLIKLRLTGMGNELVARHYSECQPSSTGMYVCYYVIMSCSPAIGVPKPIGFRKSFQNATFISGINAKRPA